MLSVRLFLIGSVLWSAAAQAHVTLEQPAALAGSYYKAVFRVGHGCEGSPTVQLTVALPEGVVAAKPMPKPGWAVETRVEKLKSTYTHHGKTVTEGVTVVTWRGGSLPDTFYDEFVMRVRLPETPGPVYFKVTQLCEKGRIEWSQVPVGDKSLKDYKTPAAVLEVLPAETPAHH